MGEKASAIQEYIEKDTKGRLSHATVYDYTDLEMCVVWAYLHEEAGEVLPSAGLDGSVQSVEIRQPHGLGFLPWVARVGGTSLRQEPGHQRIPLLYSVYQSGQWDTQNILECCRPGTSPPGRPTPRSTWRPSPG